MGVHTHGGESGFFDEDTELPLVQNETIEDHETANDDSVGKFVTNSQSHVDGQKNCKHCSQSLELPFANLCEFKSQSRDEIAATQKQVDT